MTCIEKLREIYPDYVHIPYLDIPRGCPHDYYISPMVKGCEKVLSCKTCWNREIPEERFNRYMLKDTLTGESMRRLDNLCDRLNKDPEEVVEAALLLYEDALNAIDEGNRRWMTLEFVGVAGVTLYRSVRGTTDLRIETYAKSEEAKQILNHVAEFVCYASEVAGGADCYTSWKADEAVTMFGDNIYTDSDGDKLKLTGAILFGNKVET